MNKTERPAWRERNRVLVAVYPDEASTESVIRRLNREGCQMDLISVLGRQHAIGDDTLGIYHLEVGDRMRAWGKQGAFWGGLWGLLAGAAGLFVIPGVGPVLAAGHIVEAIAGGTAIGAAAMSGSAAVSQLAVAFHRAGIPEEKIESLHRAITEGKVVLMVRGAASELGPWRETLASENPLQLDDLPYSRVIDKA